MNGSDISLFYRLVRVTTYWRKIVIKFARPLLITGVVAMLAACAPNPPPPVASAPPPPMAMAAPAPEQPYMAPAAPRRHYVHRMHRRHYVRHRVHHVRHRMVKKTTTTTAPAPKAR